MYQYATYTMVGLGPGNIVLDPAPVPPPKGHNPQISAHVCCGQTASWIKMPLGTKVGLGPGRIVLHGDPAPPSQKWHSPQFRPMSIVAKRSLISATAEHLLPVQRYASVALAMALCLSVRRWYCIETDEQIELVFGVEAALGLLYIVIREFGCLQK